MLGIWHARHRNVEIQAKGYCGTMIAFRNGISRWLRSGCFILLLAFHGGPNGMTANGKENRTISFLGIGDSIMAGYNVPAGHDPITVAAAILAKANKVVFANGAISGAKSGWFVPGQTSYVNALAAGAALSPPANICVYEVGVNNAKGGEPYSTAWYIGEVTATVKDLVAHGYTVILLDVEYVNGPVATANGFYWKDPNTVLAPQYNAALAALDNGRTIRYIAGLYAWSQANQNTMNFQDGVHPTATGAVAYGAFVAKAINTIIEGMPDRSHR
jgi:lysophospholipase L1-like esterase